MEQGEDVDSAKRRRRWLWWGVEVILVVALLAGVQVWRTRDVPDAAVVPITAVTATGGHFDLDAWRSARPRQVVALYFWADWCPVCRAMEGSITRLSADWPVMTVAMQSGDARQVADHLRARGLAWPAVVDTDGRVAAAYGLHVVPALLVIDTAGRIRFAEVGYTSEIGMRLRLWWAQRGAG